MSWDRGPAGWGGDAAVVSNPLPYPGGLFQRAPAGWSATFSTGDFFRATRPMWTLRGRVAWPDAPPDTLPPYDESDDIVPGDTTGKDQGDI